MVLEDENHIAALIFRIFRLDDLLKSAANAIARPAGQTGPRWQVMNAVAEAPATVADIARSRQVARQGVQRIVDEMVDDGLLQLCPNPRHRRFPLVEPTEDGMRILRQIRGERDRWLKTVEAHFGAEVEPAAFRSLDRLRDAIEKTMEERTHEPPPSPG